MVLGGEEGADVPVEFEVGLPSALDRLVHLRIGGMDELPEAAAQIGLPRREPADVVVDARVSVVAHANEDRATALNSSASL